MNKKDLFNLSNIPERTIAPRSNGLTMVMDKGLSLSQAQSLVEVGHEIIDLVKIGFGTSYVTPKLQEKILVYKEAGFKVYFGGTLFEAYIIRNQFDDYCSLIEKLKINTVEVSDGSISIPHKEKCNYIEKLSKNFTVLSEVGSKDTEKTFKSNEWVEMMERELKAGAWKVIAEARESGTVGIFNGTGEVRLELISDIINKIPTENIIWEAPKKSQQVWFIKQLGQNVNLGNISNQDVIALETLRLGLRGDTFFDFIRK